MNQEYDNKSLETLINEFKRDEDKRLHGKIMGFCGNKCFEKFDKNDLTIKEENCIKKCFLQIFRFITGCFKRC